MHHKIDHQRAIHQHVTHEDSEYFHLSATRSKTTGEPENPRILFPHSILRIKDKNDLKVYLDRYSKQVVWKSLCPDSEFARRWYVEKIRPTMRFYCSKLVVPIPDWLTNDDYFMKMDPNVKHSCFGPKELHPIVFKKLNMHEMALAKPGSEPVKPDAPPAKPSVKPPKG